ncbi:MAG: hypothetical protein WAN65_20475 [Candidatus Sulfotelmatobacter sp.]
MKTYNHMRFTNSLVVIDDSRFDHCSFDSCIVRYSGAPYQIIDCSFSPDTRLEFEDAAMRTAALMEDLGLLQKHNPPQRSASSMQKMN